MFRSRGGPNPLLADAARRQEFLLTLMLPALALVMIWGSFRVLLERPLEWFDWLILVPALLLSVMMVRLWWLSERGMANARNALRRQQTVIEHQERLINDFVRTHARTARAARQYLD